MSYDSVQFWHYHPGWSWCQTPQVQGSLPQGCSSFRCQSQVQTSHTSDRSAINWGFFCALMNLWTCEEEKGTAWINPLLSTLSLPDSALSQPYNNSVRQISVGPFCRCEKWGSKRLLTRVEKTAYMDFSGPEIQFQFFHLLNFNILIFKKGLNVCLSGLF